MEFELPDSTRELKEIDLLHLTPEYACFYTSLHLSVIFSVALFQRSDVDPIVSQIVFEEPLITESKKPHLRRLIYKLIEKLETQATGDFFLFKILRAHILPVSRSLFAKCPSAFTLPHEMLHTADELRV